MQCWTLQVTVKVGLNTQYYFMKMDFERMSKINAHEIQSMNE